ncbi:cache domain-containing protein [bacterium]|nr:cache domain-containing protein [bacterium]
MRHSTSTFSWLAIIFRTALPVGLTLLLMVGTLFYYILPELEQQFINERREMLRDLAATVWGMCDSLERRVQAGELTREEAQASAIDQVRTMRYGPGGKDYYWINDLAPTMIMHPYRPDLEGEDLTDIEDGSGRKIFREIAYLAAHDQAGYIGYTWQWMDQPSRTVPKLSYIRLYEPWGWVIGTGIYVDDIHLAIDSILGHMSRILGLILFAVLLISAYVIWQNIVAERGRLKAEESLRLHFSDLEQKIRERTFELNEANQHLMVEIEERREIERKLKLTEERFVKMMHGAAFPVLLQDRERVVDCNDAAVKKLNAQTRDEVIGHSVGDFFPERQPNGLESKKLAQRNTELTLEMGSHRFEWLYRTVDGQDFLVEVSLSPVLVGGKQLLYAIWRDMDLERTLTQALRESEERFRLLSDASEEGVLLHDQGVITHCNAAMTTLTGFSAAELIGTHIKEYVAPESMQKISARMRALEVSEEEGGILRKDGSRFLAIMRGRPFTYRERDLRVVVIRDVTEQRRMEKELRQSQVRAAELETIQRTAATYAHEINNPLTGVLGIIQLMLEEDNITPDQAQMLSEGREAARKIRDVIKKIESLKSLEFKDYTERTKILDLERSE